MSSCWPNPACTAVVSHVRLITSALSGSQNCVQSCTSPFIAHKSLLTQRKLCILAQLNAVLRTAGIHSPRGLASCSLCVLVGMGILRAECSLQKSAIVVAQHASSRCGRQPCTRRQPGRKQSLVGEERCVAHDRKSTQPVGVGAEAHEVDQVVHPPQVFTQRDLTVLWPWVMYTLCCLLLKSAVAL